LGIEIVVVEFSCGIENVETVDGVTVEDGSAVLLVPRFGEEAVDVVGTSSPESVLVVAESGSSSATVCDSAVEAVTEEVDDGGVGESVDAVDTAGLSLAVAEESAGLDVADEVAPESVGSASATPGMVTAAHPTPSATADAPTRPTYVT
jgi:hypothetical protein